ICPFSSLAFFQPTTVDKESNNLDIMRFIVGRFTSFSLGIEFSPTSKLDDLLFKIAFLMILATWIKARKTKGAT
ncbi:hypothetical protein, partial [Streptococcus pneumoniae]